MRLLVESYNNYFNSICYTQTIICLIQQNFFFHLIMNFVDTADDIKSMRELPITEPKKSNQIKDSLLKMMPKRILQQILITDARDCFHISLVASDRIWVSDYDNNRTQLVKLCLK